MDLLEDYFWRKPTHYQSYYGMKICGYVDLICCVVTVISNSFVVAVFTRKTIVNSSTNTIFTHIAITESLAIISYSPRVWHEYFRVEMCSIPQHRTFIWETVSMNSIAATFIFRQIAVWLGVLLAVWRYIAVVHPLRERDWCNMQIARIWIAAGYVGTVLIAIPAYFSVGVGPAVRLLDHDGCSTSNHTIGQNITIYEFQVPVENYPLWFTIEAFSYGLLVKILPSVALATISYKLIVTLIKAKESRKNMIPTSLNRNNSYNCRMEQKIRQQTDRTTIILLAILILFIIAEVPQGVCSMLAAYYGPKFLWKYWYYIFEVCNCLTHITESLNFLVYYAMSHQFRSTFKALFNGNSNSRIVTSQRSTTSLSGINTNRLSSVTTICFTCA